MKTNFGDKKLREAMMNDPMLRGQWETPKTVHALDPVDHLINKVGIGIVQTVEAYYKKYCEKPSDTNARAYVKWRFRLHRHLKNDTITLESINEARNLGLHDEEPGKTFWDCEF